MSCYTVKWTVGDRSFAYCWFTSRFMSYQSLWCCIICRFWCRWNCWYRFTVLCRCNMSKSSSNQCVESLYRSMARFSYYWSWGKWNTSFSIHSACFSLRISNFWTKFFILKSLVKISFFFVLLKKVFHNKIMNWVILNWNKFLLFSCSHVPLSPEW